MVDWESVFSYSSVRFVRIRNWKLGLFYFCMQLLVFCYILIYSIILQQGYQQFDTAVGATSLKVKGTASTGIPPNREVFDAYDLIVPPTERDALFVTTSQLMTSQQRKTICDGIDPLKENCTFNANGCRAPYRTNPYTINGLLTGDCNNATGFCRIESWCPLENDTIANYRTMSHVGTWTTYVKINVRFPLFDAVRSNTNLPVQDGVTLFSFDEMLAAAGYTYDQIKINGTVLLCTISYNCNLNPGGGDCNPSLLWSRIDDPNPASTSTGFNYRYTKSTFLPIGNGTSAVEVRNLYKVTGIRVLFYIHGVGGKFSAKNLLFAIGSGLGLLSIASVVCDFLMEKVMRRSASAAVQAKKYLNHQIHDQPMTPLHPADAVAVLHPTDDNTTNAGQYQSLPAGGVPVSATSRSLFSTPTKAAGYTSPPPINNSTATAPLRPTNDTYFASVVADN